MKCDSDSWSEHKKQWNLLSRKSKDSEQNVINDQLWDCNGDSKKLFILVNSLLGRNKYGNALPKNEMKS